MMKAPGIMKAPPKSPSDDDDEHRAKRVRLVHNHRQHRPRDCLCERVRVGESEVQAAFHPRRRLALRGRQRGPKHLVRLPEAEVALLIGELISRVKDVAAEGNVLFPVATLQAPQA
jgi:hypothetical protein